MIKFSDLTEQQVQGICEAFAKMEGYECVSSMAVGAYGLELNGDFITSRWSKTRLTLASFTDVLPAYTTDLNAMWRIIEGMTYITELYRYHSYLTAMFEASVGEYAYVKMHKATAQQQFVAAAMALVLLKEGEK
jgi:hypothetical protein